MVEKPNVAMITVGVIKKEIPFFKSQIPNLSKTFLLNLILVFLITSCSKKQNTLSRYADYPVSFKNQNIVHPDIDFSISIPEGWEWKIENYENENLIFGFESGSKPDDEGYVDILSIQKLKSFGNKTDLKSEFNYYLKLLDTNWNADVIENGKTDIFGETAYYFHTKSNTGTYGEIETISFILRSEMQGVFYNLTASASQTEELIKNMAIMIDCLQTFEKKKTH